MYQFLQENLLNTYYLPGVLLRTGNTKVKRHDPLLSGRFGLSGNYTNKLKGVVTHKMLLGGGRKLKPAGEVRKYFTKGPRHM